MPVLTLAHNRGCARKGNGRQGCTCGRGATAEALERAGWIVEYAEEVCRREHRDD